MDANKVMDSKYHHVVTTARQTLVPLLKFCIVGGTGVIVDMGVLFLLADSACLALPTGFSKACAAEAAMANNFIWNEIWTFKRPSAVAAKRGEILRRFLVFNAICGVGIVLAVLLLQLFHRYFGWNLYLANLGAIVLVTFWNFGMNAKLNWRLRMLNSASN